jgi:parallel beta-helix repeat protein
MCDIDVHEGESIQHAINSAPDGAVIRLAPGNFLGGLIIDRSITLQGASGRPQDVHISRVPAQGGNMPGIQPLVHIERHRKITVRMENLYLSEGHHGLWATGTDHQIELTNCIFSNNRLSGFYIAGAACVNITNCVFCSNIWGLYVGGSAQVSLAGCRIYDNESDGLIIEPRVKVNINNCQILRNGNYGVHTKAKKPFWRKRITMAYVTGNDNFIPGPGKPDGNKEGALCPPYPGDPWPDVFLKED